jgi:hypothetical protein
MERVFINGLIFKAPSPKAPDWVKGKLSIKVDEFSKFIQENNKCGWVNIDLKQSREGKYYAELNTYEKDKDTKTEEKEKTEEDINIEDIPF